MTGINVVADLAPEGDPADATLPALVAVVKRDALTFNATKSELGTFCGGDGSPLDGVFRLKD